VLEVFCDLAGTDPNTDFYWQQDRGTRRWHLEQLWHQALDEPDRLYGYTSEAPF